MNRFTLGERVYDSTWGCATVVGFYQETCVLLRYDNDTQYRNFVTHPGKRHPHNGKPVLRSISLLTGDGDGI